MEKRSRIDLLDIRDQRAGQAHIFQGATLIRADLFYARPPSAPAYRLNRFIEWLPQTVDARQAQQDGGEMPELLRFPDLDGLRAAIGKIEDTPNALLDLLDLPHNAELMALRRAAEPVCFTTGLIDWVLKVGQVREQEFLAALATVGEEEPTEETLFHCGLSAGQPPLEVYQDAPDDAFSGVAVHREAHVAPHVTIGFQEAARRLDPDFAHLTPGLSAGRWDGALFSVGNDLGVFDAQEVLAQMASIRPPSRRD